MTAMNRRSLLRGVATAVIGCTLIPSVAESAPTIGNEPAGPLKNNKNNIEKTRFVRRRRRRGRCWWQGDRRVCVP